ncbi:MAG: hypothetical protein ABSE49_24645, partial [Polyangiaceae bacterium]
PFWIARGSGMSTDDQRKIIGAAHVRIYGDTWLVDQREPNAPLDAYSLNEREPGLFEWLLFDPTEVHRSIGPAPDPWLTWEWRTHLGQDATPPTGSPVTMDEMRIAHNVAIASGDGVAAERWREKLEGMLDRTVTAKYDTGLALMGVRVIGGVEPRVESWFEVGKPFVGDDTFAVRSNVEKTATLSLIPPDTADRDMAFPEPLPTKLWKPGAIYVTTAILNHRIGVERYSGRWIPRDGGSFPHRTDNRPDTVLVVLP